MSINEIPEKYLKAQTLLTFTRYTHGHLKSCPYHGLDNVRIDGPKPIRCGNRFYFTCRSCETAVKRHKRK